MKPTTSTGDEAHFRRRGPSRGKHGAAERLPAGGREHPAALPEGLRLGSLHCGLPDRRRMERRWQRRIYLGPLLAHARQNRQRRSRRPRLRSLSPLPRRHRAHARDESLELPFFYFLAENSADRLRQTKSQRTRFLQPPYRHAPRSRHSPAGYALPLGPATVPRRRRRLAQSRDRRALCRLLRHHCSCPWRSRFPLAALQRARRLHQHGIPARHSRARQEEYSRLPARRPHRQSRAGCRIPRH